MLGGQGISGFAAACAGAGGKGTGASLDNASALRQHRCVKLVKPDANLIRRLLNEEKDERYRYLLRHGNVHHVESDSLALYVELPQIPNITIVYRRPGERENCFEKYACYLVPF